MKDCDCGEADCPVRAAPTNEPPAAPERCLDCVESLNHRVALLESDLFERERADARRTELMLYGVFLAGAAYGYWLARYR